MKKYLLDTSVLLDLFLNRLPWAADMALVWDAHRQGRIQALVAAFSIPTIFYVVRKQAGSSTAQAVVQACLSTLDIAPIDQATLLAAQARSGPDFEDDLQIACAVQARVDAIITRDPRGFAASPIPLQTPADLVASLPVPPTP
ncbi:MAG: PIN domain-containing protein [Gemmataceae bacterium]